jgi:hypothetical protein
MRIIQTVVFWTFWMLAAGSGCSAITDFPPMPEEEGEDTSPRDAGMPPAELYSIDDNLADNIEITLHDDSTGTLTMSFDAPLPSHEEGDSALEDLIGDIITLEVQNDDGINVTLSDGERISGTPDDEGEWTIELGNDFRTEVNVTFYNEFEGRSMQDGDEYTANIAIAENDYFEEESFVRDVTVTQ